MEDRLRIIESRLAQIEYKLDQLERKQGKYPSDLGKIEFPKPQVHRDFPTGDPPNC